MTDFRAISYNPATATLTEAREVVRLIRDKLSWANGEYASELWADLRTWEDVLSRFCPTCEQRSIVERTFEGPPEQAINVCVNCD